MVDRRELAADILALRGKRTGYRYAQLAKLLEKHEFVVSGKGTSHRTWSHVLLTNVVTLIDAGKRELLPVYIKKTRDALQALLDRLNENKRKR